MTETEEYRLRIEAYTPETMPMQRLAEYLAELARMLGERASVHFVRLESGSTSVIHRIEREAIPRIRMRIAAIQRGIGPRDSVRAYHRINRMLREDNGSAIWRAEATAEDAIVFPGKNDAEEAVSGISQRGHLDGEVVRIGGLRDVVPVMLRCEQEELSGCWAKRTVAKELARRLFEPVRLYGTGRWNRNDEGKWKLDIFRVESFVPLREATLSQALGEIRAIPLDWDDNSFEELADHRNGREEPFHGGL